MEIATTVKMHHATRTKAEKLVAMLAAEYPALSLDLVTNEDASQVSYWTVSANDEVFLETDKVPSLAEVLEACEENGIDPEEGEEDEPEGSGSVVPEGYRARYREVSTNGQTCGDWLAEWLTEQCHGIDGFSVADFASILDENQVDRSGAWARLPESGQKGWVGRWRMNGRQALEKVIARTGKVIDPIGNEHEVPSDALAELQRKHQKYLDKQAKLEAALKQD